MYKPICASLALVIGLAGAGCLKTRAQLRDDGSGDDSAAQAKPQPAQVQDVQPPAGGYALDEIKTELTRLEGRVEDLERAGQQNAASAGNKDELKKLEQRITELEQAQLAMLETIKKMQDAPPAEGSAQDPYDKAKAQFDAANYEGAADLFTKYLANPKAKRGEEATFYRAEAFFNLKKFSKAITDYSKFTDKYKASSRTPNALYKIGLSFEAIGEKNDAKYFFEELVEKYPKSAEAKRVKSRSHP